MLLNQIKHECKDHAILWEKYVCFFTKWYKSLKIPVLESAQTDRLYRQVNGTANPFAKEEEEEETIIFLFAFFLFKFFSLLKKEKISLFFVNPVDWQKPMICKRGRQENL